MSGRGGCRREVEGREQVAFQTLSMHINYANKVNCLETRYRSVKARSTVLNLFFLFLVQST